jgi:hypothetical protein
MLQPLIKLLFHLCRCAQTQRSPASATMNLLFCTAPRDDYVFLSSEVYPNAFAPFLPEVPDMPDITTCIDNNDRAMVQAMHARNKKTRADIGTINTTLAIVFLEVMSSQVRASFQQRRLRKQTLFLWTSSSGLWNNTAKQRPRTARQTANAWPPTGTLPTDLMPSSFAFSPAPPTPAAMAAR